MVQKALEQKLEQCLERRMDGTCRKNPPLEGELLLQAGGFKYDTDTHTIESRITPKFNATLKQGLVAEAPDTAYLTCANGAIGGAANSDWSVAFCFNPTTLGSQVFLGTFDTTAPTKRFYITLDSGMVAIRIGTGGSSAISSAGFCEAGTSYTLMLSFSNATGIVTSKIRNMVTGTVTNLNNYTVVGLDLLGNPLGIFNINNGAASTFLGKLWNLRVWFSQQSFDDMIDCSYGTGANLFLPLSGSLFDISGNNYHASQTGATPVVYNGEDYSEFRNAEQGFAVKTSVIHPKLLEGTGYAGLAGEPDLTFQGLIATKGKPEIGMNDYLGTLYDFGNAAEIVAAGIKWDDWDNADCNLDLVGTAETNLDTDYYNAITSSLMSCEGMIYGGTSNVAQRMFFKVSNLVMKADGSFLAGSGTVTDILVYKRDLTPEERLRVMKWCKCLPFTSVDLVGSGTEIFGTDSQFFYSCL